MSFYPVEVFHCGVLVMGVGVSDHVISLHHFRQLEIIHPELISFAHAWFPFVSNVAADNNIGLVVLDRLQGVHFDNI